MDGTFPSQSLRWRRDPNRVPLPVPHSVHEWDGPCLETRDDCWVWKRFASLSKEKSCLESRDLTEGVTDFSGTVTPNSNVGSLGNRPSWSFVSHLFHPWSPPAATTGPVVGSMSSPELCLGPVPETGRERPLDSPDPPVFRSTGQVYHEGHLHNR